MSLENTAEDFNPRILIAAAKAVAHELICSEDCSAASVGAALMTSSNTIHTGVCIDTACSLGFCAEHAAIADMLKHRKTHILAIVAVNSDGDVMPPCGRCRELMRQVDPRNWHSRIIVSDDAVATLEELMPYSGPSAAGENQ
ncbi:hypothetical protein LZK98_15450 [Sphingomonas cannabina]|uniref:cytidine deaminase family protein n=1 Tax=Sphingomonas cannabina TaxID=2899123 RepID=UPI001F3A2784|nr:hypothetical protein [Sphingomonas cannabina]UIJ44447.1 hypothetical protein LZK98_15450 [Sphingomonas cannabina]